MRLSLKGYLNLSKLFIRRICKQSRKTVWPSLPELCLGETFWNLVKKDYKKKKHVSHQLKEVISQLENHSEDLLVADSSRHGWLTVHQLRGKQTLPTDI